MSTADELRALRLDKEIPAKDMAAVVQRRYPKFDKTGLSKCEHGDDYGVHIKADALDDLYAEFAPERLEARRRSRNGKHRLTCRVSARLEDDVYEALQRCMRADGYATNQAWITAMALRYISEREADTRGADTGSSRD